MKALHKVGLETLVDRPDVTHSWGRCGLLCNQASVDRDLVPTWAICRELLGDRLVALFGPQHGIAGTVQDNMIETDHGVHCHTGLPVYSLYSETREPSGEMLSGLDCLIVDLQITGCRVYTWKSTIAGCLRSARRHRKKVVILDRPNPLGGVYLEGRVLDSRAESFVGQFPIPMRHGLTAGEAARFFNRWIQADLEVIPLQGWDPRALWGDLDREWVLTSPNLPTIDPVYVYPGTVMLEGTNISEGRGTGLPFQLIGAPYVDSGQSVIKRIEELGAPLSGVYLRDATFQPTYQKWKSQDCNGVQIHVRSPAEVRSYMLTLVLIRAFMDLGKGQFKWKKPPYEYDYETLPMKLIVGSLEAVDHLERLDSRDPYWSEGVESYIEDVKPFLLYERTMVDVTRDRCRPSTH